MKVQIVRPEDVEIKTVRIVVPNRYGTESIPADFPGLNSTGTLLTMEWDIDTGVVKDWPQGRTEDIHLKVTDAGSYFLLGELGQVVLQRANNYVPHCVVPGKYGDYIIMSIDGNGKIRDYAPNPNEFDSGD